MAQVAEVTKKVEDSSDEDDAVLVPNSLAEIKLPPYFIKSTGAGRLYWDIVIIILSLYNSFTITITIAFDPDALRTHGSMIGDAVIDLIFLFDIVLTFRSTYLDPKTGTEVSD